MTEQKWSGDYQEIIRISHSGTPHLANNVCRNCGPLISDQHTGRRWDPVCGLALLHRRMPQKVFRVRLRANFEGCGSRSFFSCQLFSERGCFFESFLSRSRFADGWSTNTDQKQENGGRVLNVTTPGRPCEETSRSAKRVRIYFCRRAGDADSCLVIACC